MTTTAASVPVSIRPEVAADAKAISALTTRAFTPMPYASGSEAAIVDALRAAGALKVSLVAVDADSEERRAHPLLKRPDAGDKAPAQARQGGNDTDTHEAIVGHIAFSRAPLDDTLCGWYALGPLSVAPEAQRKGVGSALVRAGLDAVRRADPLARGCVLLGSARYYARFGFEHDPAITTTLDVPKEHLLRLVFDDDLPPPRGQVTFHDAFTHT